MSSAAVIDYGMGNLHSIAKALQHAQPSTDVLIASDADTILHADRVVFPGVGAIRDCIAALHEKKTGRGHQTGRQRQTLSGHLSGHAGLTD